MMNAPLKTATAVALKAKLLQRQSTWKELQSFPNPKRVLTLLTKEMQKIVLTRLLTKIQQNHFHWITRIS